MADCKPSGYQIVPEGCLDPGAYFTPVKTDGVSPVTVTFQLHGSPTYGDNEATTWCMDFGDGQRQGGNFVNGEASVTHTYTYSYDGTYMAKQFYPILTVQTKCGAIEATKTGGAWVGVCGVAASLCQADDGGSGGSGGCNVTKNYFTYKPDMPKAGDLVSFSGHDSCAVPNFFTWYIKDVNGNTLIALGGLNPKYTFPSDGMYKVVLRTTGANASWYESWQWVQVGAGVPAACQCYPTTYWEFSPANPQVGDSVTFTSKCTCAKAGATWAGATGNAYLWKFDDGSTNNGQNAGKIFQTKGMHHVVLRCENEYGWWEWWNDVPVGVDSPVTKPAVTGIVFIPASPGINTKFTARVNIHTTTAVPRNTQTLVLKCNDAETGRTTIAVDMGANSDFYVDFDFTSGVPTNGAYNFCAEFL